MNHERRVRKLLETALEVPAEDRRAVLEEMSGDPELVDETLALLESEGDFGDPLTIAAGETLGVPSDPHDPPAPRPAMPRLATPSIPGFLIERTLGEGGMGRVYLARQTRPVERTVAIKMIAQLEDESTAHRFAAEQRALARLNHPAIAQLYDAGTTPDGQPYVVMEYVDGTPLTDYCDRECLSIEDRLRLFVAVCRGIEHAHRRQLLHRDLKPSNLLVTEADGQPVPKIIDFGIARALDAPLDGGLATGSRILGTPHYMSPEALDLGDGPRDLDTRSDVYSLGVVLYELLTGVRPFASRTGHMGTLLRRITEDDPPRPSTRVEGHDEDTLRDIASARSREGRELARRLDGDLDWIAVKALARDREERYGSAAALADDIERSLRHEPVTARPPSLPDRFVKLVRRHRLAAALVTVTLVAILASAVLSSLALVRATHAERRALGEAAATRETLGFLVDLFEAARPERNLGRDLSPRELVTLGADRIDRQNLPPLQRARLLHTLADVQMRLGDYGSGRALAAEALAIREEHPGEGHPDLLASLDLLGNLERRAGHLEAAEPLLEREVAVAEETTDDPAALAAALNSLANLRWRQKRLDEAEELYGRALDLRRELFELGAVEASELAASLNNLGVLFWAQARFGDAEPYLREALELYERTLGPEHPRVADALGNLGIVLYNLGRLDEDEALQRRALAIREKVLDADHPDISATLNNLAVVLTRLGRLEEAEAAYRRALEIRRKSLGPGHVETLKTVTNLGLLLWRQGRFAEAEALHRQVLTARAEALGEDDPATARARVNVAVAVRDAGRLEEAETMLRRALADQRAELGEDHRSVAMTLFHLGVTAELSGRDEEAETLLRQALAIREAVTAPKPLDVAETLDRLAGVVARRGDRDEAKELYRRALELRRATLPAGHEDIEKTAAALARLESPTDG